MITAKVEDLDKQMEFLQNEAQRLRAMQQKWADIRAGHYDPIIELLRQIRQDKQMRTVGGKRLDDADGGTGSKARPDQEAIDAAPELRGKKALVLYFETQDDLTEFLQVYKQVHPKTRTVQL